MTKQLNKKGTSLVELIAVIVIMGIIAGIAIPTTIAVINRQKKNAAKESVRNVITTAKDILLEAQAQATNTTITLTAEYAVSSSTPSSFSLVNNDTNTTAVSGFAASDMNIDSLKMAGTITGTLTVSSGTIVWTAGTVTCNGITVTIAADGSVTA